MKMLIDTENPAILNIIRLVNQLNMKVKDVFKGIGPQLFWIISTDTPSNPKCNEVRIEAILTRCVRTISIGSSNGFADERSLEACFYVRHNPLDVGSIKDLIVAGSTESTTEENVFLHIVTTLRKRFPEQ